MGVRPGSLGRLRLSRSGAEAATALVVLLGSLYLFDLTFYFTKATKAGYAGEALFPQIALGLLIFCAAKLLLEYLLKKRRQNSAPDGAAAEIDIDLAGLAPIIAITVAYALLLDHVGFEICTFALMLALLGARIRLVHAIWASALSMLVIYAVFALALQVDLPLRFLPAFWPF
jgi:Tripartite tricarboxylate transporter TctB family